MFQETSPEVFQSLKVKRFKEKKREEKIKIEKEQLMG